MLKIDICQFRA